MSSAFTVGTRVLLKKCAFDGRHKLDDKVLRDPFVVTAVNETGDIYKIRPILGGPMKVVNRRLLVKDPRDETPIPTIPTKPAEPNNADRGLQVPSNSEIVDDLPSYIFRWNPRVVNDVDEENRLLNNLNEDIVDNHEEENNDNGTCRRSQRRNKGQHSNPCNLPRPALQR